MNNIKSPKLYQALIPIIFLIVLLALNVIIFKENTLSGANQIVLLLSAAVAGLISIRLNISYNQLLSSVNKSISIAFPSILILLIIGSLAGTWLISGIIPLMIYYGLKIIHPSIFLLTAIIEGMDVFLIISYRSLSKGFRNGFSNRSSIIDDLLI